MEENDPQRPRSSGPNRAMLPLLQPPALQHSHTITNFYIDNILRPDFGRQRKARTSVRERDGARTRGATKPGDPQLGLGGGQDGDSGSSDDPDSDPRRPDLISSDPAGQVRERSPEARAAPAAKAMLWPAWVYCTRYSDRPSSGPRSRKPKKAATPSKEDKRPRTAFTAEQLQRLKTEFQSNRYLTEQRRQDLARDLGLNESQIKIWFQNKRAKIKKAAGNKNSLALHLMAQGLYNHSASRDGKSDSD